MEALRGRPPCRSAGPTFPSSSTSQSGDTSHDFKSRARAQCRTKNRIDPTQTIALKIRNEGCDPSAGGDGRPALPLRVPRRKVVLLSALLPPLLARNLEQAVALEDGDTVSLEDGPSTESVPDVPQVQVAAPEQSQAPSPVLEDSNAEASEDGAPKVTRKVFFEVAKDGEPLGRIVIGLYGQDVPIGAARFAELAIGKRGISYRKREFAKITSHYVQNAGIRTFALSANDKDVPKFTGGETSDPLIEEMEEIQKRLPQLKNTAGSVSLITTEPNLPKPKQKLVARNGGFEMVEEASRPPPNGTSFTISFADSPELDGISLVVGRVLEGIEVVEAISQLPAVKENTSSPYFRAAKLIGDTRAEVAERSFNRPYNRIVISKSGEVPF